jgi:UDP-N-acetylmuramoyl-L-alanyl-D-glutamate--2,6-diaminopimelate ligase
MSGHPTIAERLADAPRRPPRPLAELIVRLDIAGSSPALVAADAGGLVVVSEPPAYDSRAVRPGAVFVAIPGLRADGRAFVGDAIAAGAVAVLVERPVAGVAVQQVVVADARRALATAAAWWHGDPSDRLGVVGITGTDGKTTTAFLAATALRAAGLAPGLVGTVALEVGGTREPTPEHVTTPQAPELQALLAAMAEAGDDAVILETTSHALALDRVAEVAYDVAILTNLTHEHLELHGTVEAYRAAKLRLFEALGRPGPAKLVGGRSWPRTGIVNIDDPSASEFLTTTRAAGARAVTYGSAAGADVRVVRADEDAGRLRVAYDAPSGRGEVALRLAGRFNVHNGLAVVALGEALGLDAVAVRSGLEGLAGVPGRMERVDLGQPFVAIVDFAHSPASLASVLDQLAPLVGRGGGLVAVFGSAGERDRSKRAVMGRVAGERCRLVIATDEDPRGEDPTSILDEIAAGAAAAGRVADRDLLRIPDRRAAIAAAVNLARPGDVLLFAGKGHERTIEYADSSIDWDERAEVEAALRALGWGGTAPGG